MQQTLEPVPLEPFKNVISASCVPASVQRDRDVEEQTAQIFECALRVVHHFLQQRGKLGFRGPGLLDCFPHYRYLGLDESGVGHVAQKSTDKIKIKCADNGFCEKKGIGARLD